MNFVNALERSLNCFKEKNLKIPLTCLLSIAFQKGAGKTFEIPIRDLFCLIFNSRITEGVQQTHTHTHTHTHTKQLQETSSEARVFDLGHFPHRHWTLRVKRFHTKSKRSAATGLASGRLVCGQVRVYEPGPTPSLERPHQQPSFTSNTSSSSSTLLVLSAR